MTGTRAPGTEAILRGLNAALGSEAFARSERLRSFLAYVVEKERAGKAHQLKGYSIGVDVFLRPHGFDAGSDPLVRVQAGKLRKRLERYYEDEGRDEPVRIVIPIGSYVPEYHWQAGTPDDPGGGDRPAEDLPPRTRRMRGCWRPAPISSHLALLSLLPLAFLAPMSTPGATAIGINNAQLVVAVARDGGLADIALPDLRIVHCWPGMDACRALAEAIGKSAGFYRTVRLRKSADAAAVGPLSYTIRIEHMPGDLALYARLVHDLSRKTVYAAYFRRDDLRDETGIVHEAVSFAARTLGADSRIYRHALRSGIASEMMKCLSATERHGDGAGGASPLRHCRTASAVHTVAGTDDETALRRPLLW